MLSELCNAATYVSMEFIKHEQWNFCNLFAATSLAPISWKDVYGNAVFYHLKGIGC